MAKHTAWHFVHPDLDIEPDPINPLPAVRGGLFDRLNDLLMQLSGSTVTG